MPWLLAAGVAFVVVILGAQARLSQAGLGCADWPACYGQLGAPAAATGAAHRYAAGLLGVLVLGLGAAAWRRAAGRALATAALVVLALQAALGMATVDPALAPLRSLGHLLGGFLLLGLLWLAYLSARSFVPARQRPPARLRRWALGGVVVLAVQIALGGWVSVTAAGLACPGLPTCQAAGTAPLDLAAGFGLGAAAGALDSPARVAVHMAHRLWALVTVLYLGGVGIGALRQRGPLRAAGAVLLIMLLAEAALGVASVGLRLPLTVVLAHSAGAALLLLAQLSLTHTLWRYARARG